MPLTAVDGQIWLDTDASVPSTTVTRWYKLPASGTTTLSGNDDNSIPLAYTPGYEQVFLNGTLLSRSAADYTATTGTSIVLSSPIVAGDIVEVICPLQITTTDTYTQSAVNAAFLPNTNNFTAGKNKIINGDFSVWQRGTSFTSTGFTADRWAFLTDGSGATRTISRQSMAPGSISGYESNYYLRINQSVAGSGQTFSNLAQPIEEISTLAGKTVTLSFWAKADRNIGIGYYSGYTFGSGGSASIQASPGAYGSTDAVFNATTSWQKFSATWTMPSIVGKTIGANNSIELSIALPRNTTFTVDIWGVQLETGSSVTAFQTATGNIANEVLACNRYYFREGQTNDSYTSVGGAVNGTTIIMPARHPVLRINAQSADFNGMAIKDGAGGVWSSGTFVLLGGQSSQTGSLILYTHGTSVFTAGKTYFLGSINGAVNPYWGAGAEL